jgi:hypothetical protein
MQKSIPILLTAAALVLSPVLAGPASAQLAVDAPGHVENTVDIPVTVDNFVRAASDFEFRRYAQLAGAVNKFFHFREPAPLDNQTTIRMNRDTLYSIAIVDISGGATLTLPDPDGRYMTAMIVNQDHYINAVFSGGGTFTLDVETFDTPFVMVAMRTLVDSSDPEDIAAVNALQDQMNIETESSEYVIPPNYDEESFDAVLRPALGLSRSLPDTRRMFGKKEDVDPLRHFLGSAFGWGGLPESEAFYLNIDPGFPVAEYKIEVPADVPVGAFWSISLYNGDGFFELNDRDAYTVNSVTGERNDDGSITVHFGGCDDDRLNCLPIMQGWNYMVRLYRPGPAILDGSWSFPSAIRK